MKIITHVLLSIIVAGLLSCGPGRKWSKEREEKFEDDCSKTTLLDQSNLPIRFMGFDFSEVDTVRVIERNGKQYLDTFYLYGEENPNYPVKGEASTICTRHFDIRFTYDFYFGKDILPY